MSVAFRRWAVVIGPAEERPYDSAEWVGALVVVDHGAVTLEAGCGTRVRLEKGAVLWLAGLPLRALCNDGPEPVVLVAVARRAPTPLGNVAP